MDHQVVIDGLEEFFDIYIEEILRELKNPPVMKGINKKWVHPSRKFDSSIDMYGAVLSIFTL